MGKQILLLKEIANYVSFRPVFAALVIILSSCDLSAQLITDKKLAGQVKITLLKQDSILEQSGRNIRNILEIAKSGMEKEAMEFLYAFMPLSDLADYDPSFFLANIQKSLETKNDFTWGNSIPEEVFLHFVLPIRVNNENLDSFRIRMYDEIKARVQGLDMKNAALEINHWCHEKVTYRGTDGRTSSPLCTMLKSFGRCGEESTFTVAAMRTAGIPARQVYTPRWAHSDDNHAWVEVWIDGDWYFMGACEPSPDLNMGWFAGPAKRTMLVHTRAYGWYNGPEDVIMREDRFSELNMTSHYAPVKKLVVHVTGRNNEPVVDAKVEYQLYNYTEFYPIARSFTDVNGNNDITTGLGDLIIWANKGDDFGYRKISVGSTDTVNIQLTLTGERSGTQNYDMVPPVLQQVQSADESQQKLNDLRLKAEDSIRNAYMATFKDSVWAAQFAGELKADAALIWKFIEKSYGNWNEIAKFLKSVEQGQTDRAFDLLGAISEKDLSDTKASILSDHFHYAGNNYEHPDPEIFKNYILNPRISTEMLVAWRACLQNEKLFAFADKTIDQQAGEIRTWIAANIKTDNIANLHSRALLTPVGVNKLRVADSKSRDVFFVALCRSSGIASRLDPATGEPSYYSGTEWIKVYFENGPIEKKPTGYIEFINDDNIIIPEYYIHFTIAAFDDGNYRTLSFDEAMKLNDFADSVEVDAGKYMLVTGNRLSDGSVLSSISFFEVEPGRVTKVKVHIRKDELAAKSYGIFYPDDYQLREINQSYIDLLANITQNKDYIIVVLDPDKEPSKHILADISVSQEFFSHWNGTLVFLVPAESRVSMEQFKPYTLPGNAVIAIDLMNRLSSYCGKFVSNSGQGTVEDFPYVLYIKKDGDIRFISSGYKIGINESLKKEISR